MSFLHWLNTELWSPMWPNIAAPSIWTLLGVGVSHLHLTRLQRRHHQKLTALLKDKT